MTDEKDVRSSLREAILYLKEKGGLEEGARVVIGCSTSEVAGGTIGKNSVPELGRVIADEIITVCAGAGLVPVFQCCEHLNRCLVMEKAAANIREYHSAQVRGSSVVKERDGIVLGQRVAGLAKVLLYVPGGTARYPSSVLMNAIPASLAGVGEIIMTTPPSADGTVPPAILAAAKIAGVHRVFKLGGAQAVAAFAYGTESAPRVDKIVGPGNAFVAEAKRQVYGLVAIDMIAGPSEILVVSDGKNDPACSPPTCSRRRSTTGTRPRRSSPSAAKKPRRSARSWSVRYRCSRAPRSPARQ